MGVFCVHKPSFLMPGHNFDHTFLDFNAKHELVLYCTSPCNGVKKCSAPDCSHIQPLNFKFYIV